MYNEFMSWALGSPRQFSRGGTPNESREQFLMPNDKFIIEAGEKE